MPNINHLISLNNEYNDYLKISSLGKALNKKLKKSQLTKEAGFDVKNLVEQFDLTKFKSKTIFRTYLDNFFEFGSFSKVVLLFVDICNFSKVILNWSNYDIRRYLNNYYYNTFPIIYKYGGQIEKLMGDGIICVFGEPFIEQDEVIEFNLAEKCAEELIQKFKGSNKEVKIALHNGEITYYKTPEYIKNIL